MDIVMLHRQGLSKRQIAKRLGIHRGTVSRYLEQESRIHGTTCQSIAERFEAERVHLGPLPRTDFDTSARHFRSVGKDCIARFDRNRYMVPHRAVCKEVLVRVKDGLLRVFDDAELLVASPHHQPPLDDDHAGRRDSRHARGTDHRIRDPRPPADPRRPVSRGMGNFPRRIRLTFPR